MMKNNEDLLLSEFPSVSPQDWKQKIIEELKSKPYEDLIWRKKEGFDVQPFYTAEDFCASKTQT